MTLSIHGLSLLLIHCTVIWAQCHLLRLDLQHTHSVIKNLASRGHAFGFAWSHVVTQLVQVYLCEAVTCDQQSSEMCGVSQNHLRVVAVWDSNLSFSRDEICTKFIVGALQYGLVDRESLLSHALLVCSGAVASFFETHLSD